MQVFVHAIALRDGLNKILTVVDRKIPKVFLTNCMVEVTDKGITIQATDLEVSAKIHVEANVITPGSFCIDAKNFFDILKEMPNDTIGLAIDSNFNILKLNCREIDFSLLIYKVDEFPNLKFEREENKFSIESADFQKIIGRIFHAASLDETKPFLNGVFLQQIKSKLRTVATDGHRLALIDLKDFDTENENLKDGVIIPKKGVVEIKRMNDNYPNKDINISLDDSFLYINVDNSYYLSIRLIARDYPKYQTVIPKKTTYRMTVTKNVLVTALKRIKTLAQQRSNGIKLTLEHNKLILMANRPSLGGAIEKIPVEYTGVPINIGFNVKYLLETISTLDDSDTIFEFNNELSPVLIKSKSLPEFLGIIMPLKL